MTFRKIFALLAAILVLGVVAAAQQNAPVVADMQRVSFNNPIHAGDALLPAGNYEVKHVMEGQNHIMVFRQLGVRKAFEARIKCNLVPLKAKAEQTQKVYVLNAASEPVLQELIFKGENAAHVF
jgi:hypothetical protein